MSESEIIQRVGESGIEDLVRHFYSQIPDDPILCPMYPPQDMQAAEERLKDFIIYRLGGSQKYIEERGHPRLRQRHMPFAVDQLARDQWMTLMDKAFELSEFPEELAQPLRNFFGEMATFLINR